MIKREAWKDGKRIVLRNNKGKIVATTKRNISIKEATIIFKKNKTFQKNTKVSKIFDNKVTIIDKKPGKDLRAPSIKGKKAVIITARVKNQLIIGQSQTIGQKGVPNIKSAYNQAENRFWRLVAGLYDIPGSDGKKAKKMFKRRIKPNATIRIYKKVSKNKAKN